MVFTKAVLIVVEPALRDSPKVRHRLHHLRARHSAG
jgi:hypothetical protein